MSQWYRGRGRKQKQTGEKWASGKGKESEGRRGSIERNEGEEEGRRRTWQSFSCGEYKTDSVIRKHSDFDSHNLFKGPSEF